MIIIHAEVILDERKEYIIDPVDFKATPSQRQLRIQLRQLGDDPFRSTSGLCADSKVFQGATART